MYLLTSDITSSLLNLSAFNAQVKINAVLCLFTLYSFDLRLNSSMHGFLNVSPVAVIFTKS